MVSASAPRSRRWLPPGGVPALLTWIAAGLAAAAGLLHIGLLCHVFAKRATYPLDLEWMEGGMLCHALRFMESGKPLQWQHLEAIPLHLAEDFSHLPARGAVNPRVGNRRFPMEQMAVLFVEAIEHTALQRVVLGVVNAFFHLPLVSGCADLRRQNDRAVVVAE